MPTYEQLYHLDLTTLKTAVDRWAEVGSKFKTLRTSFTDRVQKPFDASAWTGPRGMVEDARSQLKACGREYEDAGVEAKGIHGVLADAHTQLKQAKADLHHLADVEAKNLGLYVSGNGEVIPRKALEGNSSTAGESEDGDGQQEQQKVDAFARRITAVLERAAEIDETTSWALRNDLGRRKDDFNDKGVAKSLTEAAAKREAEREAEREAKRQARADATRAAELAESGDLSDEEREEFQRLVHRNRNSPEFSTNFYKSLGPEGTLDTFRDISFWLDQDYPMVSEERKKFYADLQKDLGYSLATATNRVNEPHLSDEWNDQLRKEGSEDPKAYNALGDVVRYGEYDSHFLLPVTEHVAQLQVEHPYSFRASGFMTALSHNPSIAEQFFTEPPHAYNEDGTPRDGAPDLGTDEDGKPITNYFDMYTSEDFQWGQLGEDRAVEMGLREPGVGQEGRDAFGQALEAALTSRNPDDDTEKSAGPHSAGQAQLMHDVVEKFGNEPDLLNKAERGRFACINDSLGNITAEYMLDVQRAMAGGDGNSTYFPANGEDAKLSSGGLNNGPLTAFIGAVGKDPDAYGAIANAQQAATQEAIRNAIHSSDEAERATLVKDVVRPGVTIEGILTESRAVATYDEKIADDERYNKSLEEKSKWAGRIVDVSVGWIPLGGDLAHMGVEEAQENVQKKYSRDSSVAAEQDADTYVESNRENVAQATRSAALTAAKQAGLSSEEAERLALAAYNEANDGYHEGRGREQGIGR
ncbi:putative hypothetical protein [Streptomyces sp. NBRC 110611]|uniref:hypothetical protein n=1 Tax=Streptomyces sp. NBRC 110611 TaxID=1621259 RepID=UPI00082D36EA|nr:hypothetical protein [Streptomyces sp. NBRC 110611]GAU67493.1 putative hypothetical protein [Streptomyces sp. NBRC 110611]